MPRRPRRALQALAALLLLAGGGYLAGGLPGSAPQEAGVVRGDDTARVRAAFRERRSDVWVEVAGRVEAVLRDDERGSRHQRFIVMLSDGHTLLVAHNIDLAPRVPLRRGDAIRLRGEYEWNDEGGVVHWTHHDPEGRRAGGFVEHEGRRYR